MKWTKPQHPDAPARPLVLHRKHGLTAMYRRLIARDTPEGLAGAAWELGEELFGDDLNWLRLVLPAATEEGVGVHVLATGPLQVSTEMGTSLPMWLRGPLAQKKPLIWLDAPPEHPASTSAGFGAREPFLAHSALVVNLRRRREDLPAALIFAFDGSSRGEHQAARAALRRLRAVVLRLMPGILQRLHTQLVIQSHEAINRLLIDFGTYHEAGRVAERTLDYFITRLRFKRALLALVDDEVGMIFGLDGRGFEEVIRRVRFAFATGTDVLSQAYRTRRPLFCHDAMNDERVPDFLKVTNIDSLLVLPMRVENEVIALALLEFPPDLIPLHRDLLPLYEEFGDLLGQSLYISNMYQKLRQTAETDPLTGCYNRRALTNLLDEEIPRVKRYNKPLSLLMVDLCDFKKFNDLYSHVVGDRILKTVARMLVDKTRKTDKVIRYGGDEFLVLMPNTNREQAQAVVERIERAVEENNRAAKTEKEMYLLSLGLQCADSTNVDSVLEEADGEMYRRKHAQSRTKLFNAFTSNNPDDFKHSDNFVAVLIKNLSDREPNFLEHARRVMLYAQAMAQHIGADEQLMDEVSLGALLHDIGKVFVPAATLKKVEPLDADDWAQIRNHPIAGSDFLAGHPHLIDLRPIIHAHHERWDGKTDGPRPGYPDGLKGEDIPIAARIIRIAEAYDDMTSARHYRERALTTEEAIAVLENEAGRQFDPHLVEVFIKYLRMIHAPLADFSSSASDLITPLPARQRA